MVSAPAGPAWTSQYTRDLTSPGHSLPVCPPPRSRRFVRRRLVLQPSPGVTCPRGRAMTVFRANTGPFSRRNVSMHESLQSCVCQWLGAPGSFRPSKNRCRTASVGERRRDSGGLVVLIAAEAEYREKQDAPKCERESPEDTLSEGAGHTDVNPVYGIQLD